MKALVTGGAGFVGFWLSRHLALQGAEVTIIDNFSRARRDAELEALLALPNVTFLQADVTKASAFESLPKDFDFVYHLAMINGTGNFYKRPRQVLEVGVVGTLNVLSWFITLPKAKLLFTSSSEAYAGGLELLGERFPIPTPEEVPLVVGDPSNVRWSYGASKILGEVACHAYAQEEGMKSFTILRYHNVYGPRMGFDHVVPQFIERLVKREDPFAIYGGQEARTFIYVEDAVRATQLVMEHPDTAGKTIHVGRSDGEIRIIDLAKRLFAVAGSSPHIEVRPAPAGSVMRRCPDTKRLRALGFEAKVDLDEGLRRCYDWYARALQTQAGG